MNLVDARFEVKELSQSGSFSGYGNVYNVIDGGDDIVAPGAFADSLQTWDAKGRKPAMLWQHKSASPIGAYQVVKEDKMGLYVEGQLALKTQQGAEAYELLKMDALSGMSIGFETKEATIDQKSGVRTITKGDLWEVSLVTFPMNDMARVSQVKSIDELFSEIKDWRDFEFYLRESGISRAAAMACVAKSKALSLRESDGEELKQLAAAFKSRITLR